ncbi:MAG: hypothetical protein FWC55_05160 [Firmicutes bacterium]|nr:hypothetical protein [Bacillota bacterium]
MRKITALFLAAAMVFSIIAQQTVFARVNTPVSEQVGTIVIPVEEQNEENQFDPSTSTQKININGGESQAIGARAFQAASLPLPVGGEVTLPDGLSSRKTARKSRSLYRAAAFRTASSVTCRPVRSNLPWR